MKKQLINLALLGMIFLMGSCKKEDTEPTTPSPNTNVGTPDGVALANLFSSNVESLKQTFTVNAGIGGTIIGNKGTKFVIPPNSLVDAANNIVSGDVKVEIIEIFDKATMVLTNKPTMGIQADNSLAPLVSGGEFYLEITQNGQELLTNSAVIISVPTEDPKQEMDLFVGIMDDQNDITWDPEPIDSTNIVIMQDSSGGNWSNYYSFQFTDLNYNWINCDFFYNNSNPKTSIKAILPEGYTGDKVNVFMIFSGINAITQMSYFNVASTYTPWYEVPIGLEVHFIAVTAVDGQLHYAIQSATIVENHVEQISSFTAITQEDLEILINNLP